MSDARSILGDLYWRYKELALRAGASLTLGDVSGSLESDARALRDTANAAWRSRCELEAQFAACREASEHLYCMIAAARDQAAAAPLADQVLKVRTSHKRFRAEVWKVLPCEYAPCSAAHISTEHVGGSRG